MFIPEKMVQINVVFFEKDVNEVADAVVRQGSLQVVDAADMEDWAKHLHRGGSGEETSELKTRRDRIEGMHKDLGAKVQLENITPSDEQWEEIDVKVNDIERSFRSDLSANEEIGKELSHLEAVRDRIDTASTQGFTLKMADEATYLAIEIGHLAEKNVGVLRQNLKSMLHVLTILEQERERVRIVVIALKRDQDKLKRILQEVNLQPAPLDDLKEPPSLELVKKLDKEIDDYRSKKFGIRERLDKLANDHGVFLYSILLRIRRDILKIHIRKYFRKTERTFLLSGWLPHNQREEFIQEIRRSTQNRCIIQDIPAEKIPSVREGHVQVPVELRNPRFLKPFEILTKTYGIPAYTSIDPTPILGISFLLMFGVMFGDVGHGLVLCLTGLILTLKGKKPSVQSGGLLFFYAGIASMIFGFLFGSIFGIEHLLPTLWLKPMESISKLFKTAIFFGIGMISLAMLVNLINGIRKRDFLGLIFDKAGLLAAVLYWCGIVVVTRDLTMQGVRGGLPILVPVLMLGSVALLFLREPIVHLIQGKRKLFPEGMVTGIMGGIVEILEILLGFLANTVSFIRVAAFGLAHAGLFMAIFALSDAVKGVAGGLISGMVFFFGNILIIGLEGLVVSIQAVRLEFYEFFSRFFQPGATGYRPLKTELR